MEDHSIVSLESEKNRHECHDLDVDCYFRYQLIEDEPHIGSIRSPKIVGRICDQFNLSNVYATFSKEIHSNENRDCEETKDIEPYTPRKGMIPSKNIINPSPPSEEGLKTSTYKVTYSHSTIA